MAVERHRWAYEAGYDECYHAFRILHWQRCGTLHVASQVFTEVRKVHLIYARTSPKATVH
jgi:hypothetical protein